MPPGRINTQNNISHTRTVFYGIRPVFHPVFTAVKRNRASENTNKYRAYLFPTVVDVS
jgi:hypothetical protein